MNGKAWTEQVLWEGIRYTKVHILNLHKEEEEEEEEAEEEEEEEEDEEVTFDQSHTEAR